MTSISPLNSVHLVGNHGNFKNKNSDEIINIKELKNFKNEDEKISDKDRSASGGWAALDIHLYEEPLVFLLSEHD